MPDHAEEEESATEINPPDEAIVEIPPEETAQKPGLMPWLTKNWLLMPVMVFLAIVGFLLVVFIWNRVTQSQTASQAPASQASGSPPTEVPTSAASPLDAPGSSPSSAVTPASPPATVPEAEPASPQPAPQSSTTPSSPQAILNQAYKLGMSAAVKTQTATTQSDWNSVIQDWQQAIQLLETVPAGEPTSTTAQQKINEYRRNLNYAQQRLTTANP